MKKILVIASTASMIDQFNRENIKLLISLGYKVHVATNFQSPGTITREKARKLQNELHNDDIVTYNIDFERNPFNRKNIVAYNQLNNIMKQEKYDTVHCHSPIGGVIGRLVAKKNNVPKIIYTAHGFHFFKGGPKKDWLIYYPIEKYLSKITDVLITINNQDYNLAKEKLSSKIVYKVNGIGIDIDRMNSQMSKRRALRVAMNIKEEDVVLFSIGELSNRKNHIAILRAIKKLENIDNIKYLICGLGPNKDFLEEYIKSNNLEKTVFLLGFKETVEEILPIADIFCFPSKREGLPVALIEAISVGLPCIVSNIRGNNDLIDSQGGYLVSSNKENYEEYLNILITNKDLRKKLGIHNKEISKLYDKNYVMKQMKSIYNE